MTFAPFALPAPNLRCLAVWRRNLLVWRKLMIGSILSNIAEPLITLIAFGYGVGSLIGNVGDKPYVAFLASGAISVSVLYVSTFEALYSAFSRLDMQKTWESIAFTPTSYDDIVLAELMWAATKGIFTSVAILLVIVVLGISRAWTLPLTIPALALCGACFASIGLVVTAVAKRFDFFSYYFTLVVVPMTFLSGVYFPLEAMPSWLQMLGKLLPLYASVQLVRPMFFGAFDPQALWHITILLVYGLVAYYLAAGLTRRRFR